MKRAVRLTCALLILVLGCSSTHDAGATEMDAEMAMDGAALDARVPEPAACGAADEIMNLRDSRLRSALFDAKDACDQRLHRWACGDLRLVLDAQGCVTDVQGISSIGGDAASAYVDCLLAELSPTCSRCEHSVAARVYYSCTIQ